MANRKRLRPGVQRCMTRRLVGGKKPMSKEQKAEKKKMREDDKKAQLERDKKAKK